MQATETIRRSVTTAEYRASAREAERLLLWNSAARLWELAADNYPSPAGALAKADIARMRERAASCDRMAKQAEA